MSESGFFTGFYPVIEGQALTGVNLALQWSRPLEDLDFLKPGLCPVIGGQALTGTKLMTTIN